MAHQEETEGKAKPGLSDIWTCKLPTAVHFHLSQRAGAWLYLTSVLRREGSRWLHGAIGHIYLLALTCFPCFLQESNSHCWPGEEAGARTLSHSVGQILKLFHC